MPEMTLGHVERELRIIASRYRDSVLGDPFLCRREARRYEAMADAVAGSCPRRSVSAILGGCAGVCMLLAAICWMVVALAGCSPAYVNATLPDRLHVQHHGMAWDRARDEYGIGYPERTGRGYTIGLEWDLPEVGR